MHRRPVVKRNTNHSVEVYCIKSSMVSQNLNGFFALASTLYLNDKAKI